MAKIFFSLSGEGRGHATRVRALVELLRGEHQLTLFTSLVAYDLLASAYQATPHVRVRRIPGLQFAYRQGRLDYFRSVWNAVPYLGGLPRLVDTLAKMIHDECPDLAIVDFEPALPRAARRCGLPYVSFDHQHFLVVSDLSALPWSLRWRAWLIGLSVGLFCRGQQGTIVSSFFRPPRKRRWAAARQIGALLRPEVLRAEPVEGDHLLVYLRRFAEANVMQALRACGRRVRLYGQGTQPADGNIEYRAVEEEGFLADLASCYALISNAGNQLVGEALFLRKPMLALPEPGNFEQAVNAHFLRAGGGDSAESRTLTPDRLQQFLQRVPRLRNEIRPEEANGNEEALLALQRFLQTSRAAPPAAAA
ncbi:MAG: teichoic acid biosynthesis protein [Planctomycetes bacterium]|nr:teichoic acid biosynthesis protein [Planctomycetota bacterium]